MKADRSETVFRLLLIALLGLSVLSALFVVPVKAEYGDVVLNDKAESQGMRPVIFPHWFHRIRFRCKVCHVDLGFEMRAGANDVTMGEIANGKFCGACHNGEVAWSIQNCALCHNGKAGLETKIQGCAKTLGPGRW